MYQLQWTGLLAAVVANAGGVVFWTLVAAMIVDRKRELPLASVMGTAALIFVFSPLASIFNASGLDSMAGSPPTCSALAWVVHLCIAGLVFYHPIIGVLSLSGKRCALFCLIVTVCSAPLGYEFLAYQFQSSLPRMWALTTPPPTPLTLTTAVLPLAASVLAATYRRRKITWLLVGLLAVLVSLASASLCVAPYLARACALRQGLALNAVRQYMAEWRRLPRSLGELAPDYVDSSSIRCPIDIAASSFRIVRNPDGEYADLCCKRPECGIAYAIPNGYRIACPVHRYSHDAIEARFMCEARLAGLSAAVADYVNRTGRRPSSIGELLASTRLRNSILHCPLDRRGVDSVTYRIGSDGVSCPYHPPASRYGCSTDPTCSARMAAIGRAIDLYTAENRSSPPSLEAMVPRYLSSVRCPSCGRAYAYHREQPLTGVPAEVVCARHRADPFPGAQY